MSSPIDESLYRPAVVKRLMAQYGLKPKKAWGQNFLVDGNTVDRIVQATRVSPGDAVIEIGPGLGALTQGLLRAGARVVAIEKDRGLAAVLRDVFSDDASFDLIVGDALKTPLADVVPPDKGPYTVAANLPYYITSPLLMHILESPLDIRRAVVMVQKEVAHRLAAAPGTKDYGALTVAVAYRARVEMVAAVPPTVFLPSPAVHSQIIALTPHPVAERVDAGDADLFSSVVKAAFGQRRKTLRNALGTLPLPARDYVDAVLASAAVDGGRRGETLSLQEFAAISRQLSRKTI